MRRTSAATVLVILVGLGACDGRACTAVGGVDGITVAIPRSLFVRSGDVALEVCDTDGCASATRRLGRLTTEPTGRAAVVTFGELGRQFRPGPVTVTVRLSGPGSALVAVTRQAVALARSYPNGKACDGDGYVSGTVRMHAADRV